MPRITITEDELAHLTPILEGLRQRKAIIIAYNQALDDVRQALREAGFSPEVEPPIQNLRKSFP